MAAELLEGGCVESSEGARRGVDGGAGVERKSSKSEWNTGCGVLLPTGGADGGGSHDVCCEAVVNDGNGIAGAVSR